MFFGWNSEHYFYLFSTSRIGDSRWSRSIGMNCNIPFLVEIASYWLVRILNANVSYPKTTLPFHTNVLVIIFQGQEASLTMSRSTGLEPSKALFVIFPTFAGLLFSSCFPWWKKESMRFRFTGDFLASTLIDFVIS